MMMLATLASKVCFFQVINPTFYILDHNQLIIKVIQLKLMDATSDRDVRYTPADFRLERG